jgi:hypothetical protein
MVVNNYPADQVARTLRRVVGGDNFSAATRFTISEQKVASKAKAKTLLSPSSAASRCRCGRPTSWACW